MIRLAFCLLLTLGATAMAAPKNAPEFNPFEQIPAQDGTIRQQDAEPSDKEMMLYMWRRFAGDKPIPKHIQDKYGLPEKLPPLPAGR